MPEIEDDEKEICTSFLDPSKIRGEWLRALAEPRWQAEAQRLAISHMQAGNPVGVVSEDARVESDSYDISSEEDSTSVDEEECSVDVVDDASFVPVPSAESSEESFDDASEGSLPVERDDDWSKADEADDFN